MAFFRAKIGEKVYELDKLTLGQARLMKRRFDLTDLEEFNIGDPDHMVGILTLCLQQERPAAELETLIAEVEALDIESAVEMVDEEDPTQPAEKAESEDDEAKTTETIQNSPGSESGD